MDLANVIFEDSNTYEKIEINPGDEAKEIIQDILLELYTKNDKFKKLLN